jgi:hypothetical protein
MNYETPEILTLGTVEELTFGGYLAPFRFDFWTGYTGHRPGEDDRPE